MQTLYARDHYATLYCRCGHSAVVVTPSGVLLPEIQRRARCRACGEFGVQSVTVHGDCGDRPPLGGIRIDPDGTETRISADEWPVVELWRRKAPGAR